MHIDCTYTELPTQELEQRHVRVGQSQFYVILEEELVELHAPARPPTRIVLTREQLLALLVALPVPSLQAALRVQATGDAQPFLPQEERDGTAQE